MKPAYAVLSLLTVAVAVGAAPTRSAGRGSGGDGRPPVDFAREVRPILSDRCFACHGPDEATREAGLRLDVAEEAFADLGGYAAVVPGDVEASELWHRVAAEDDFDRMPPPHDGEALSAAELETLRRWIAEGATWERHWAFVPPVASPAPSEAQGMDGWARDDLDRYVLARLVAEGVVPSPEAAPETLLRRLSLDLSGVPPTLAELDAFLADHARDPDGAVERSVDRLLASPRYGERMALPWLDAARYADTNGYHRDATRTMWLWRDWLIEALNANKPYDEMLVEMLAGDQLDEPRVDQLVATGFNRNHMLNDEGGAIPEEYQVEYVIDRVRTTSAVFLGLTMQCAQCHDHKYDPVSQEDFYRFYAFFNKLPEKGLDGSNGPAEPAMVVPRAEDLAEMDRLRAQADAIEASLHALPPDVEEALLLRERAELADVAGWTTLVPEEMRAVELKGAEGVEFSRDEAGAVRVTGANPATADYELVFATQETDIAALMLEVLTYGDDGEHKAGSTGRTTHGNWVISEFELEAESQVDGTRIERVPLVAVADYSQDRYPIAQAVDGDLKTGWAVDGHELLEPRNAVFAVDPAHGPLGFAGGTRLTVRIRQRFGSMHAIGRFRLSLSTRAEDGVPTEATRLGEWSSLGPVAGDPDELFAAPLGLPVGDDGAVDLGATVGGLAWESRPDLVDGEVHALRGANSAFYFHRELDAPNARSLELSLGSDDSLVVWLDGARVLSENAKRGAALDQSRVAVQVPAGRHELVVRVVNYGGPAGFAFRVAREAPPVRSGPVTRALRALALDDADVEARRVVQAEMRRAVDPDFRRGEARVAELDARASKIEASAPGVMVMRDQPGVRMTQILERGRYDRPTREVQAGVPAFLPPLVARNGGEPDRLDLARWMVADDHPLTARVQVNRIWSAIFGTGLVETADDFGAQGEFPTYPELLDRLAADYVAGGWDTKALVRRIVTSATYRQSSRVDPGLRERDPLNRLLARAPSYRLPAELVRDGALFASGLLVEELGGPSVRPYQPEGLWKDVSFNNEGRKDSDFYTPDSGAGLYRRGMYTFWKRALPPPSLTTFDAPTREVCVVRRANTNTPLQALVLMNDPTYVEAARHLAMRALSEGRGEEDSLERAFRRTTSRRPRASELETLRAFLADERVRFGADPGAARALLSVGESMVDASLDEAELAAWTSVGSVLLNLDETITRR